MDNGDFLYKKLALKFQNLIVQKARHPKATAAYGRSAEIHEEYIFEVLFQREAYICFGVFIVT
jgi:hypothetical protein